MATRHEAETLALRALGWIAGDEEMLGHFMAASGASPAELRARAQEPEFLGAVLDFLLMDDNWVTGFCDAEALDYTAPARARAALPGGAPDWG
ncbi:MAG: DUF3572 domain-containing protein [Gemmobacter sp.]